MATRKRKTEELVGESCKANNASENYIFGWESAEKVAADVWGSIHCTLLTGALVFAYRATNSSSELVQVVVTKNIPHEIAPGKWSSGEGYAVGMVTNGFSMLLPKVTIEYLESELLEDLKKYKVGKEIIDTYVSIVFNCKKKEGNSNG